MAAFVPLAEQNETLGRRPRGDDRNETFSRCRHGDDVAAIAPTQAGVPSTAGRCDLAHPLHQKTVRDAAILLRSLPAMQRSQLVDKLEPAQAAAVAAAMNELDEVGRGEQNAVVREFARVRIANSGDDGRTIPTPFEFLGDLDADALLDLIADEHPQTIALVLSHIPSVQAGPVLAGLSAEQQFAVVCRLATMGEADPDVVRDVENALRRQLFGEHDRPVVDPNVASAVRILNAMEPAAERRLLAALSEADPRLVARIRRAMFGVDVAVNEDWSAAEAAV